MINKERERELEEIEKKLGTTFLNKALLNQALTHSSYANEMKQKGVLDNERLEFLGDAVLKLIISEYLYNKFPGKAEGYLTKIRATVISDETLAVVANRVKIGAYILLGANERRSGGRERKSNLANTFEALIAAIYLDGGLGKARDLILDFLKVEIERTSGEGFIKDFKSALQELVQKRGWGLPAYHVVKETGPKHKKVFFIEAKINGRVFGEGKGFNKKEAEQEAAKRAYEKLTGLGEKGPLKRVGTFLKRMVRRPTEKDARLRENNLRPRQIQRPPKGAGKDEG